MAKKKRKSVVKMLPLPDTWPDNGFGHQTLSVVEQCNGDGSSTMHVSFAWWIVDARSWGAYVAKILHVMAHDYPGYLGDWSRRRPPDTSDVLEAMLKGFNERMADLRFEQEDALADASSSETAE